MSVFDILTMIGGLALFLYGMEVMGNGLSNRQPQRLWLLALLIPVL